MAPKTPAIQVATPPYWEEACKHLVKRDRVMKKMQKRYKQMNDA